MASDSLYYVEHLKPAYLLQTSMAINGWHAINHSTCLLTAMIIAISTDDYLKEDHRSYIRNCKSCLYI